MLLNKRLNSSRVHVEACTGMIAMIRIWRTFLGLLSRSLASRMMLISRASKSGSQLRRAPLFSSPRNRKDKHRRRMIFKTTRTQIWRTITWEGFKALCKLQMQSLSADQVSETKRRLSKCLRCENWARSSQPTIMSTSRKRVRPRFRRTRLATSSCRITSRRSLEWRIRTIGSST